MAYIYKIVNDINDKVYIGKTEKTIEKRFKEHIHDSKRRRKEHRPLYNAMNKYGIEHFKIFPIEKVNREKASEREKYWIKKYNSCEVGYNATLGGDGKSFLDYKKILKLYDTTKLNQKEIAEKCNCSVDSVRTIVNSYRENVNWHTRSIHTLLNQPIKVRCIETGDEFDSCNQAGKWLVKQGKIKSSSYGRNRIGQICNKKLANCTVGGYHWEKVN